MLIFKLLFKIASLMPRRRHVRVSNGPAVRTGLRGPVGRAVRTGLVQAVRTGLRGCPDGLALGGLPGWVWVKIKIVFNFEGKGFEPYGSIRELATN